jgi:Tol biopolymer transport system component
VAVVSDGRDGSADGVELHIINSKSGRMRKVSAPSETTGTIRLGHNDPDFSPDGKRIAFTYNDNAGTEGDPRIGILTCRSKSNCTSGKTRLLKSGYANPSWSPSGALLAVETTDERGRDIAIITSKGGHERVQLTNDGDSFAPEFSPSGDQIAYLKRDGLAIDVRIMSLEIDDKGKISLVDDRPVTSDGEVDGESGLSWYIPRSERSRSVDAVEAASEEEAEAEDLLEGAPPPPPTS